MREVGQVWKTESPHSHPKGKSDSVPTIGALRVCGPASFSKGEPQNLKSYMNFLFFNMDH